MSITYAHLNNEAVRRSGDLRHDAPGLTEIHQQSVVIGLLGLQPTAGEGAAEAVHERDQHHAHEGRPYSG
jgi:hypothetical protein